MTLRARVDSLKAAAAQVAEQAKNDQALVDRLLANPAEAIAEVSGQPTPAGLVVTAARNAEGAVEISASADPHHDGELDDVSLAAISGGATAVEYGLIASLVSVAIIAGVGTLSSGLGQKFQTVASKLYQVTLHRGP